MPDPQATFSSNRADVAAKVIDGELIIIRLSDGTYYSMDNVGTCIWELIDGGHALGTVVETIAGWYAVPADQVTRDVTLLVSELLDEGLIIQDARDPAGAQPAVPPAEVTGVYEPPSLAIYRDMGNLLALDPPTPGIDDLLFRDTSAR